MKYSITKKGNHQFFRISYTDEEVGFFMKKYENLGLSIAETKQGFGIAGKFSFWRDVDSNLALIFAKKVGRSSNEAVIDDINSELIGERVYNISIFRVVPKNNSVEIKLNKYITIAELNTYVHILNVLYSLICNLVAENVEIDVKIKNGEEKNEN